MHPEPVARALFQACWQAGGCDRQRAGFRGGPAGGDASATDCGSLALLFGTLEAATNTGQRFVFSQGNTTANAHGLRLFFEKNSSSDLNALQLRVGNLTTTLLAASNPAPAPWYDFAMTRDEVRKHGEVRGFLGRANGMLSSGVVSSNRVTPSHARRG